MEKDNNRMYILKIESKIEETQDKRSLSSKMDGAQIKAVAPAFGRYAFSVLIPTSSAVGFAATIVARTPESAVSSFVVIEAGSGSGNHGGGANSQDS